MLSESELRTLCQNILNDFFEGSEPYALAQAWLAEHPEIRKTVRVRIACVINADGHWSVAGWPKCDDEVMIKGVHVFLDTEPNHDTLHWIDAEIPLPVVEQPQTIRGKVT